MREGLTVASKGSFGNFIILLLGQMAVKGYKSYRKQRRDLVHQYFNELDKSLLENRTDQANYESDLRSLPVLEGDGIFGVVVNTTTGDTFALESFSSYLSLTNQNKSPVTAVLAPNATGEYVEIELSGAILGVIDGAAGVELYTFLRNIGTRACCAALLSKTKTGYRLKLDIALPPRLGRD